jgi:UDP-N-acetylmuramoyl-L-alanyl-D-glutamate--2,6-diaminopimelate ligase
MRATGQALESLAPRAERRNPAPIWTDMPSEPRPLAQLLAALPNREVLGDATVPIAGIGYRSQEVRPGWLFFCVPGTRTDGHRFAAAAAEAGAVAVVVERRLDLPPGVTQVVVQSVRPSMGPVAAAFYGRPADALVMVGVTGTNGKTTTTYLLERIFREAGLTPGVIGTTGIRVDGKPAGYDRTTPEAPDLQRILAEMRDGGVGAVAMEVSSHGLHQHRVDGVRYGCAVFTNLSQDHLDYHGTLQEYFEVKSRLFTPVMARSAAINADSPEGRRLLRSDLPTVTYGLGEDADVRAEDVMAAAGGLSFRVGTLEISSPLRGAFNVHNSLAALAAARQVGIDDGAAVRGIAALHGVPGRMEPVESGQPFQVLVDYAHTPDSLENVLRAARPLADPNRVIAVFGCGGDRDRGKRPLMGRAATSLADLAVITSDNPRSEDPSAIIVEIEPGAALGRGRYVLEPDRRRAIRVALAEARAGDVVVIAGKGHETGQELADRTIPFDDRIVAREELEALLREGVG